MTQYRVYIAVSIAGYIPSRGSFIFAPGASVATLDAQTSKWAGVRRVA